MKTEGLDKLAALEAAMTAGPWSYNTCYGVATIHTGDCDVAHAVDYLLPDNATGIVAIRNASKELLAVARSASAYLLADGDVSQEHTSLRDRLKELDTKLKEMG